MTTPPTKKRPRLTPGTLGTILLLAIALPCLITLPYTLALASTTSSAPYKRTNLEANLLPPSFITSTNEEVRAQRTTLRDNPEALLLHDTLGTDALGRSLLTRLLAGGAVSLGIGLAAAAISVVIGTLYGSIAAYAGGRTDAVMMRIVDVLFGLPYILLVVLLAVAVGAVLDARAQRTGTTLSEGQALAINVLTLLIAIGGVSWLTMARVIRGQVLSLKEQPFMESARAIGAPARRQFIVHLLPNLLGPIIVYGALTAPQAILQESFLSFLGIGVQPPLPSWGNLAAEGLNELNTVRPRWWLLLFPSLLLASTLLALNFLGEALRERFDPKHSAERTPAKRPNPLNQ